MYRLVAVLLLALSFTWGCEGQIITNGGNVIAVLASGDITDFGYKYLSCFSPIDSNSLQLYCKSRQSNDGTKSEHNRDSLGS